MEALKELGQRVDRELEIESTDAGVTGAFMSTLPSVSSQATAFGFALGPDAAQREVMEHHRVQRRARIKLYRDHSSQLQKLLDSRGIEPLAMITRKAWMKIVADHGLINVCPSWSGSVAFDMSRTPTLKYVAGLDWVPFVVGLVFTFATTATGWLLFGQANYTFSPIIVGIVGAVILMALLARMIDPIQAKRRRKLLQNFVKTQTHKQLLQLVSTHEYGMTYLASGQYSDQYQHDVVLPEPPSTVLDILKKLNQTQEWQPRLFVAAEPDAIQIAGGWAHAFVKEVEAEEARRIALKADPILYLINGEAVAILAQYGEGFKLEEAAIEAVINSEHLL